MNLIRYIFFSFFLTMSGILSLQAQETYVLKSSAFSNSSQTAEGSGYIVNSTVGQTITGSATSSGYQLTAGFLPTAIPRQAELTLLTTLNISPTEVVAGESTSITFTVFNTGAVGIFTTITAEVYLSANVTFEPEDIRLDSFEVVTNLAAGGSFDFPVGSNTKNVMIPDSTSTGEYQLFVVLHTTDVIDEINSVNVFGRSLTVQPNNVDTEPPVITLSNAEFFDSSQPLSVTIIDASPITANLYYRPITSTDAFNASELIKGSGASYTVDLSEQWADELGMEGYVVAIDAGGYEAESIHFYLYRTNDTDAVITFEGASFDGKTSSYRIFSIPYDLQSNNLLSDIFTDELGPYNPDVWRVFHYGQNGYFELSEGSRIDLGKGYWFNTVRNDFSINIGEGAIDQDITPESPFSINFRQGWNMVGNPYPFPISWADIQAANPERVLNSLFQFENGNYSMEPTLDPWTGGFVYCESEGTVIFPLAARSNARIAENQMPDYTWSLTLTLQQSLISQSSLIGMHPDARFGKDPLDEIAVPRFIEYLEIASLHPDYFASKFLYDVVPDEDQHVWNLMISSSNDEMGTISWNKESVMDMIGNCFMLDLATNRLIDMSAEDHYQVSLKKDRQIKVFYSRDGSFQTDENRIGVAYPNPFDKLITIPVLIKEENTSIEISIFDFAGKEIHGFETELSAGSQFIEWDGYNRIGNEISEGVYFLQVNLPGDEKVIRIIKKQ